LRIRTKVLLVIAAAATWFWLSHGTVGERRGTLTNVNLQAYHEGYNEKYFAGQLPSNVTVTWGDLTAQDDMGQVQQRLDGSFLIVIDRNTNQTDKQALLTMQHEECHVAVDYVEQDASLDDHGPAFNACMLRLAERGAMKGLW
jgi:SprT-like family